MILEDLQIILLHFHMSLAVAVVVVLATTHAVVVEALELY
jgi:hypothetical protein